MRTAVGIVAFLAAEALADPAGEFRIVTRTESSTTVVKLLDQKLTDGRYVAVEERILIRPHGSSDPRLVMSVTYMLDCESPRRIKVVATAQDLAARDGGAPRWQNYRPKDVPESFHPRDLTYETVEAHIAEVRRGLSEQGLSDRSTGPAALPLVVEYGCRSAVEPTKAEGIAEELRRTGGFADLRELVCELRWGDEATDSATVRFSPQHNAVQWQGRWQPRAYVDADEIGFVGSDNDFRVRISRRTGTLTLTSEKTGGKASGQCELAENRPRKF